ncbi:toxin-antitoxin system HicB family antitoxin [Demequina sp. B12]|uniref:toxin-antitoxin system HicB family antitoxin n=1 Tax=Demequina sp. B12 TaxID=2992757 RepID=UPI00237A3CF8|nr:toxin-antitoxin system HicB family antitoxin [Demequina sp. B12]MDE0572615.1 toxin-antitoxin system HicB family antitoxin [Demequina sp. B12]
MELEHYTEELQRQLAIAASAGTPETQEVAERLGAALEAAARVVLVEALSEAAGEISRDLAPGSVDVRVRGKDVDFVVANVEAGGEVSAVPIPVNNAPAAPEDAAPVEGADDAGTSRTTLRLPDGLKQRAETMAAAEGLSLNTWLVRAVTAATRPAGPQSRRGRAAASYTGWVR